MECIIVGAWLFCALLGAMICEGKGQSAALGLFLGLLFGPIGVIICSVLGKDEAMLAQRALKEGKMKKCPACAELIKRDANVCRYCSHEFASEPIGLPDPPSNIDQHYR